MIKIRYDCASSFRLELQLMSVVQFLVVVVIVVLFRKKITFSSSMMKQGV